MSDRKFLEMLQEVLSSSYSLDLGKLDEYQKQWENLDHKSLTFSAEREMLIIDRCLIRGSATQTNFIMNLIKDHLGGN